MIGMRTESFICYDIVVVQCSIILTVAQVKICTHVTYLTQKFYILWSFYNLYTSAHWQWSHVNFQYPKLRHLL